MRTGAEAQSFFVVGKVFAMLYTETAGDTFVVVQVKRGFVKAW
jgi:hypothetical protein